MTEDEIRWRLEVLRPLPRITRGGEEISLGERGGVSLAVAIYLILTRRHETRRQDLVELFRATSGGGFDLEQLRKIIHRIRQTFGPEAISVRKEALQWKLPVETDADELLAMTPGGVPDPELALYAGDFLSEWDKLGHAGRFRAWVKERRDEYRAHAFHLLDARARLSRDAADWEGVRRAGARISALWPAREEGYLWEVLGLEGTGDLARAESRLEEARRALEESGKVSGAFAQIGERLRKGRETEIARRADNGPEAVSTSGPEGSGSLSAAAPVTADDPSARAAEQAPPAPAPEPNARVGAADAPPPTAPAAVAASPALRPVAKTSARRRRLVVLAVCAALAGAWLSLGPVGLLQPYPVCRDGLGRATLVVEVHQEGRGFDAGADFNKVWVLRNEGPCVWETDFRVVRQPPDSEAIARMVVLAETVSLGRRVLPGETAWIKIQMWAPQAHAHIQEYWSLLDASESTVVVDGSTKLPVDFLVRIRPVPLCAPGEMVAGIVATSHAERQVLATGTEFTGSWTLINQDLCGWPPGTALQRTREGADALSGPNDRVLAGDTVLPGETVTFLVPMRAPARPATYAEEWELVAPGDARIPVSKLRSVRIILNVVSPGQAAQLSAPPCAPGEAVAGFVSETPRDTAPMGANREFQKAWTIRNPGRCRWDGSIALRFVRAKGIRVSGTDEVPVRGMVMPNHTYTFVVPGRTPLQPGDYEERWELRTQQGEVIPLPNRNAVWMAIRVPKSQNKATQRSRPPAAPENSGKVRERAWGPSAPRARSGGTFRAGGRVRPARPAAPSGRPAPPGPAPRPRSPTA